MSRIRMQFNLMISFTKVYFGEYFCFMKFRQNVVKCRNYVSFFIAVFAFLISRQSLILLFPLLTATIGFNHVVGPFTGSIMSNFSKRFSSLDTSSMCCRVTFASVVEWGYWCCQCAVLVGNLSFYLALRIRYHVFLKCFECHLFFPQDD